VHKTILGDNTKDIITGVAITSFIFLIAVFLPIIGFLCAILVPLPILFYRLKLGRRKSLAIPVLTVIAMVIVIRDISFDFLFFAELVLLGFVLSEYLELDLTIEQTILSTCGWVLLTGSLTLFFYSNFSNTSVLALISDYVKTNLEVTLVLYKEMGMSDGSITAISNSMDKIHYTLVRILPGLSIISILMITWTNILIARGILINKRMFFPDFGRLNLWKSPEGFVWGAIGCTLVLLLIPDNLLKMIGLNGIIILMTIYFFQGIAIVAYFFEKKRLPRMFRIFLYSFIALQQIILLLVIGLGFFDMWLNFRKLGKNGIETV
jgi:uncharacterized protein YybS (DUF2232 family)